MSLKYFHLVFLFFAMLMDGAFWSWTRFMPEEASRAGAAHLGPYAGWIFILLLGYSAYYLVRKMKTIIV
jgi:hypothetical protein